MSKKPSMEDVIREDGVSKSTVSLSLRGEKGLSEEKRTIVMDAADKITYDYDSKCTSNNDFNSICIIINIDDILLPRTNQADTYYAIQTICIKENIRNIVYFYDDNVLNNEIPSCIKDGIVKGIVVMGEVTEEYYEILEHYNIPIVMLETYLDTKCGNKVLVDNVKAGYDAAKYLINKGHSNIAFYTDDNGPAYIDRWLGYVKAPKGMGFEALPVLNYDNFVASLRKEKYSAIVFGNAKIFLNIEQRLNTMGISIPDEMSFIVFDDCDTTGFEHKYNLTKVTVPKVELGVTAVNSIIYKMENPGSGQYKILIQAGIKEGQTVKNLE